LSGKLVKSFIPLFVVFGLKYLPFDEDQNLIVGRMVFAFKFVITALFAGFIFLRVNSLDAKAASEIVKEHEEQGKVVPAMSVSDYDKTQLVSYLKAQILPSIITAFIHYKFNYIQPLYISTVLAITSIYDWNLFQIYVLRRNGSTDKALRRPFPASAAPTFADVMKNKLQEAQEQVEKKDK